MRRVIASLNFSFVSAIENIVRNLWLSVAGVVTMALILVVIGAVLIFTHSVGSVVDQQKNHASKLQVYLQDSVSEASIAHYQAHLASDPRVVSVDFTNKDQALQASDARGDGFSTSISVLGANPLPASLDVRTKQLNDIATLDRLARSSPIVDTSSKYATDYNSDVTGKLISFSGWVTIGGIVASLVFGFISLVIIMVTIRTAVFVRRTEIEIMKLVGATDWFVRWPFMLEGAISGIVSALLSGVTIWGLYHLLIHVLQGSIVSVPYDTAYITVLLTLVLMVGAGLGALGSYLGVRRFLSV